MLFGMLVVPCHWDFTKTTRARANDISHIHKNGPLYEPRTHVRQCSGQAGSPTAAAMSDATSSTMLVSHHRYFIAHSLVSLFFCQQAVAYTKYTCSIIFV